MDPYTIREFSLAGGSGDGRRPYLNSEGAFIGLGTPILERDAAGRWRPRDTSELGWLLKSGYGNTVDKSRIERGLGQVARALNKGDLSLASIALVHCELPSLRSLEDAKRMAKTDGLLAKYNPDWIDEPRVPAGETGGGEWTDESSGGAATTDDGVREDGAPPSPSSLITDVAYQGKRHDELVQEFADDLRNGGVLTETNLPITMIGGEITAVADIVFKRSDTGALCIIEAKTGTDPTFTPSQMVVYPMAMIGQHAYSDSPRIENFGFSPGQLLPPIEVYVVWEHEDGHIDMDRINPEFKKRSVIASGEWR